MTANAMQTTAEKMTSVKAAWDKTGMRPKKAAAPKHDRAARAAQAIRNDAECNKELNAATLARH